MLSYTLLEENKACQNGTSHIYTYFTMIKEGCQVQKHKKMFAGVIHRKKTMGGCQHHPQPIFAEQAHAIYKEGTA